MRKLIQCRDDEDRTRKVAVGEGRRRRLWKKFYVQTKEDLVDR